ncbi:MAG: RsmF rRNA methyltransferase first C-terminal domain-containing protein [Cellulosilyticaceae bacterium]
MKLPEKFEEKMKNLLGETYDEYKASYDLPKYQGIRINTLKLNIEEWEKINPFDDLEPVPWCNEGFYYTNSTPTKHPFYYAGLYYVQEPSAMAPGSFLPITDGDKVLDLCAAPGGKTTQVAAKLNQTGIIISNDISPSRAQSLAKNVENFGIRNAIVTSEAPHKLAEKWPEYFDKILIDAPCSGEGMFRKDEAAIKSWETHGTEYCTVLQQEILEQAHLMLKENGMMLYSTCTFAPEENEIMIGHFLKEHPEYSIVPLKGIGGIQQGMPNWADGNKDLEGALRLWPHHLKGEGHFVCLLKKNKGLGKQTKPLENVKPIDELQEVAAFIKEHIKTSEKLLVTQINERVYMVSKDAPTLKGLRVLKSGMMIGVLKNKRFEPSHSLALSYKLEQFNHYIELEELEALKYLKGETLLVDAPKGYHIVSFKNHPLGWVKSVNGLLKNQYPPTWRLMR